MAIRVGINGFGRIGRSALKAALKANLFVPAAISDIKDLPTLAADESEDPLESSDALVRAKAGRSEVGFVHALSSSALLRGALLRSGREG